MKKYGVRGPLLNAGICHLCRGDVFAIMEVARRKYIDPGVAIIEPLLNPTLLSHQSLTLAPFFFSSFFVNSSSSDDFAAFLETELEATSAESSLDEEAEDDNYKMRKQGMKNLRMRKPEMKKPRMRRLQMIMASIAREFYSRLFFMSRWHGCGYFHCKDTIGQHFLSCQIAVIAIIPFML
ncbi:uncharacterized protein LOC123209124 isoform X1 [Mangifera indica]|uniref:uncharacterized protein LOC123209124 isoform X1 n=1 Tax=Mangifera indica TaxID=29780 RepID=UPI001CF9B256|nr:uncharacterized protein LOC123209124 isoform X1 [Mangifera indica]XP_044482840.1 uncharacterized protein LOC123209124 isoform X1 [Mangifera indica]XP_044482841.1 uncharacterized protein LOC123209124 isoform X1 [Mangifera indica]XP_044482842.1 uncharacterized protein LOC123209124 isoform X1 [Mangifera indica]